MKQALKELEEMKNFANRKKRRATSLAERIKHDSAETAWAGAIEILNRHMEGKS